MNMGTYRFPGIRGSAIGKEWACVDGGMGECGVQSRMRYCVGGGDKGGEYLREKGDGGDDWRVGP